MTAKLIIAAVFVAFASVAAQAAEAPTSIGECAKLLESTEIAAEEKNLSGGAADAADELLLALDQQCNSASYSEAQDTADKIAKMLEAS